MTQLKTDEIKKLHLKKYRQQLGYFLAEGEHLALELERAAALNPALAKSELYVTEAYSKWNTRLNKNLIGERLMAQLSETKSPQGIIACVPVSALEDINLARADTERSIYLHELQDPGNLGTILRTLAWFGGFRCLLSPGCVDHLNSKVVRASMGAVFHVPVETGVEIETLPARFTAIACLDMSGQAPGSQSFQQQQCLVFGNEARGVPRELLAGIGASRFSIPGRGLIESLNVASVLSMCVYELSRSPAN
jgi:RNA methyltransferase, TrmH family